MELTTNETQRLEELTTVFLEENTKLNLSAFRTRDLCWNGNVLDSIAFIDALRNLSLPMERLSLLDVGTGGGFPLLPLALLMQESLLTGIDSVMKKIDAVDRIAGRLGIPNVDLLSTRVEEAARDPTHRERYDFVLARAVAPLNVLIEYCAPFAKIGGFVVAWKSLHIDQELKDSLLARAELSCHLTHRFSYTLPADFGTRQLLFFKKTAKTKEKYPREVGVPKKNPLV